MMNAEWTPKAIAEALSIPKSTVTRRADRENWHHKTKANPNGGGVCKTFDLMDLPVDIQKQIVHKTEVTHSDLTLLSPDAAIVAAEKLLPMKSFATPVGESPLPRALSESTLRDPRVSEHHNIVLEALDIPGEWQATRWKRYVALKHGIHPRTLHKLVKKFEEGGLAAMEHTKSNKGEPKKWSPEALDYWFGMVLKQEHRKISMDELYKALEVESKRRGWRIGGYRSATWWIKAKVNPLFTALQNGGVRALDNVLPPILRDYSDLEPFDILVGDQHRFDFWIQDDTTGKVFRPEGYLWQDLRTRLIYGWGLAHRYDSYLIGLALRVGIRVFGAFKTIYTDHGKPEESKYVAGIMREMACLGLNAEQTIDFAADVFNIDPEEERCSITHPGTHREAIVRNCKAKMIERTHGVVEGILRDEFRLPGYVKRLSSSEEEQEVDRAEAEKLAREGKLLKFSEFTLKLVEALDYYNRKRPHRGTLQEWTWKPKPSQATPFECLVGCYVIDGWRPARLSDDAINLVFLPKKDATVDRGRVRFKTDIAYQYEHDSLVDLHGERVTLKYDPLDPWWVLVFHRGKFVCRAQPVEYSSMKNQSLARRKIEEKARLRKRFVQEYRRLTAPISDLREYSKLPVIENQVEEIRKAREEVERPQDGPEYVTEVPEDFQPPESVNTSQSEASSRKTIIFAEPVERYFYLREKLARKEPITEEDREFIDEYEADYRNRVAIEIISEQMELAAKRGQD